jgi:energy-coupling factor transporter ATP-binding protein EcfA2
MEALSATRLLGFEDREPHNLSGGEQQSCSIAATYSMHPEIYVMDEPLANLDPAGRQQVLRVLIEVAKQRQKTLVIVEHSLEEVLPMVDRVLVMDGGQIVRDGAVEEVLAAGDIPRVFTRPAIVRLADTFGLSPMTFSAEKFYSELNARKPLGVVEFSDGVVSRSATSSTPIIEIQEVHYSYPGQAPALKGVNLIVHAGELVAILGRNGSGKTTLARHIIGLLQPERGRVIVAGRDVALTPTHELTQEIGFCFQNPNHQLVAFNVRDEMTFGLKAHNIDPAEFDQRVHQALELVHMLDFIDAEIFDLGKGQKQRLALASVLTLNPKILIIDEPTTGQDPQMTREIFEILKHLNDLGTTILMITHRVDYAAAYAGRAVVMNRGQVAFDGPVLELISDPDRMQANSLDVPDITKLALRLRKHGVPPSIIKYEELERCIHQLVEANDGD